MQTYTEERRPREDTETQERMFCEDSGRDWSDPSTNQGTPRIASNHQKLRENYGTDFLSETLETMTQPPPPFWTSSLQNDERINVCQVIRLWYFVTEPQKANTLGYTWIQEETQSHISVQTPSS